VDRIFFEHMLSTIRRRGDLHRRYDLHDPYAVLLLSAECHTLDLTRVERRHLQAAYEGRAVKGLWRGYNSAVVW
jgi:hypothetical protein